MYKKVHHPNNKSSRKRGKCNQSYTITQVWTQENFLELKNVSCQISRAYSVLSTMDENRPSQRHIVNVQNTGAERIYINFQKGIKTYIKIKNPNNFRPLHTDTINKILIK